MLALESSGLNSSFQGLKFCLVMGGGYGLNEGDGEERGRFWNDMDRVLDRVSNEYRFWILGELNGWRGDRTRVGITGAFGIP